MGRATECHLNSTLMNSPSIPITAGWSWPLRSVCFPLAGFKREPDKQPLQPQADRMWASSCAERILWNQSWSCMRWATGRQHQKIWALNTSHVPQCVYTCRSLSLVDTKKKQIICGELKAYANILFTRSKISRWQAYHLSGLFMMVFLHMRKFACSISFLPHACFSLFAHSFCSIICFNYFYSLDMVNHIIAFMVITCCTFRIPDSRFWSSWYWTFNQVLYACFSAHWGAAQRPVSATNVCPQQCPLLVSQGHSHWHNLTIQDAF